MSTKNSSWIKRFWSGLKRLASPANGGELTRYINGSRSNKEFIVVGLGRFGTGLAMTLNAYKHDVLAIDADPTRVQQVAQLLPHVIQLDTTNIDALQEVGASEFDTGIVCIGSDFESNLLTTFNLRKLGVRRVIAKALTVTQQDILSKVGADEVILPEHEAGVRLGRRLATVDFVDYLELSDDTGVVEIVAPSDMVGQSLQDTQIRQRYGLTAIAIRRNNDVLISPSPHEVIQAHDILVVLGRLEDCEQLRENT